MNFKIFFKTYICFLVIYITSLCNITFNESFCCFVSDEQAEELADLIYERANQIWKQLLVDEEKSNVPKENSLANIDAENSFIKTRQILDKYCPVDYGKPTVISHEEFEIQKVDKQVLYRGIYESEKESLDQKTEELVSGKYIDGVEQNGIFASLYKKIQDIDFDVAQSTEAAAEYYAIERYRNGRIFTFFYDKGMVKVLHDAYKVREWYDRKYFDNFDYENADSKTLFLSLCYGMCQANKYIARILNCDVIETYGWQYQILNPKILTFSSEYQDMEKLGETDVEAQSSDLIGPGLYKVNDGLLKNIVWRYDENGCVEIVKAAEVSSISDEQAEELADLIYERANQIWEQLLVDEEKSNVPKENSLANIDAENSFIKIRQILDKYCPVDYGKPTVISHEEFEIQKVDKQVLHRGMFSNKEFGDSSINIIQLIEQLKNGQYLRGPCDNCGIFASIYRYQTDVPDDVIANSAEAFTFGDGVICSFFYDSQLISVLKAPKKIGDIYSEKYFSDFIFNNPDNTSKDYFLSLYMGCSQYEAMARLLGCEVIELDDWQYVILNPGILTFDEEDECITTLAN